MFRWVFSILIALVVLGLFADDNARAALPRPSETLAQTLAALPTSEALAAPREWRRLADPSVLPRLDQTHEIAEARVRELIENFSEYSFQNFTAWQRAVRDPSAALSVRQIQGKWKCRALHINKNGAFALPFDDCSIRQTATCLEFDQLSGSVPVAGCLQRVDENNFAFLQTRKFDRDNERSDGFLSGSGRAHLRLIVTDRYSMDIYELVRT